VEEFKKLKQLAVKAYRTAAQLFKKEEGLKSQGRSTQCNAIAEYVNSWRASNSSERRRRLEKCRMLATKSIEAYENAGDALNSGRMCNDLLLCLFESLYVASDWKEMRNFLQEGIDCANRAITILSKLDNKSELLRAYFTASLQSWYAANVSEEENERKELVQKSLSYSEKALELSREVDNPYYAAMSNWAAAVCTLLFTDKVEFSLEYAKEMLRHGTILSDNYLKGIAYYVLALITDWIILKEGDPEKKKEGYGKIIKYAEDAIRCLQLVSQDFYIAETYRFYVESYSSQAREFETNSEKKRPLLRKAVEIGRKGLEHAKRSGSPDAFGTTLHALSKALHFYSNLETRKDEKTRLLEEALIHRREYNTIVERAFPSNNWIRGVGKHYEGLIEAELARVETKKDMKITLLENAVADMKDGLSHCRRWLLSRSDPSTIATVARFEDAFGGILNGLHELTEDKETLTMAIESYENAAKKFKEVNLSSRTAESYWKMARNHDHLGTHQRAAEIFEKAFTEYKKAAQEKPHFIDFYLDYAIYMKAWSEIERAKSAHNHEEYATAMQHYEKTASLLKPSKLWGYLSSNFLAWSILEKAEDFSRIESVESIEAFKKASELFKEAQETFEVEIGKVKVPDEKQKAFVLSRASLRRREYCLARANVEQARDYDRKGDYERSAKQYDLAATTFEKALETSEDKTEQKEMESTAYMCRAWQKMKMAEGRDLPELYREASDLFLKAKKHTARDRTSLLASGNHALCKALEFGIRFEATGDQEDFFKVKKFLGSAANYYLKAGFENASVWTGATETLFDAYNYMCNADIEVDPEKRMKTYLLAEKCLERAARLYETAGYTGKRDEVLKSLEKVKEKREFALSLGELLAAPSDASSTKMISAPGLTVEEPFGFLKFEGACVQGNLAVNKKELVVGEDFLMEVHLANLGKEVAFLLKVEDIIPEEFDLLEKPVRCTVDGGSLDLKGKKLATLESEEMKLKIEPRKKGKFVITPKIHYIDEAGKHKSLELESIMVTVKELGILGWLKGTR